MAQLQIPRHPANRQNGKEADDRRDEHQIEDVEAVRVIRRHRAGVDYSHRRVDRVNPLQDMGTDAPAALATYNVGREEARSSAA